MDFCLHHGSCFHLKSLLLELIFYILWKDGGWRQNLKSFRNRRKMKIDVIFQNRRHFKSFVKWSIHPPQLPQPPPSCKVKTLKQSKVNCSINLFNKILPQQQHYGDNQEDNSDEYESFHHQHFHHHHS